MTSNYLMGEDDAERLKRINLILSDYTFELYHDKGFGSLISQLDEQYSYTRNGEIIVNEIEGNYLPKTKIELSHSKSFKTTSQAPFAFVEQKINALERWIADKKREIDEDKKSNQVIPDDTRNYKCLLEYYNVFFTAVIDCKAFCKLEEFIMTDHYSLGQIFLNLENSKIEIDKMLFSITTDSTELRKRIEKDLEEIDRNYKKVIEIYNLEDESNQNLLEEFDAFMLNYNDFKSWYLMYNKSTAQNSVNLLKREDIDTSGFDTIDDNLSNTNKVFEINYFTWLHDNGKEGSVVAFMSFLTKTKEYLSQLPREILELEKQVKYDKYFEFVNLVNKENPPKNRNQIILEFKESFKHRNNFFSQEKYGNHIDRWENTRNEGLQNNKNLQNRIELCKTFHGGARMVMIDFENFVDAINKHDMSDRFGSNAVVIKQQKILNSLNFLIEHTEPIKLTFSNEESPNLAIHLRRYFLTIFDEIILRIKDELYIDVYNTPLEIHFIKARHSIENSVDNKEVEILNLGKRRLGDNYTDNTDSDDFIEETDDSEIQNDTKKKDVNKYWFKVGLLFATGKMDILKKEYNGNCTAIAKTIDKINHGSYRPYISSSIGQLTKGGDKNIFASRTKVKKIQKHCLDNNIEIITSFSLLYKEE